MDVVVCVDMDSSRLCTRRTKAERETATYDCTTSYCVGELKCNPCGNVHNNVKEEVNKGKLLGYRKVKIGIEP
jgi:hypothetical protein